MSGDALNAPAPNGTERETGGERAEIGWWRAIASGLAVIVAGYLVAVVGANTVMRRATGLSRDGRQWAATVLFFVVVFVLAWGLRRLQARGLV